MPITCVCLPTLTPTPRRPTAVMGRKRMYVDWFSPDSQSTIKTAVRRQRPQNHQTTDVSSARPFPFPKTTSSRIPLRAHHSLSGPLCRAHPFPVVGAPLWLVLPILHQSRWPHSTQTNGCRIWMIPRCPAARPQARPRDCHCGYPGGFAHDALFAVAERC